MNLDFISIILFLHVIGAMVLVGTGSGIAFFMVMANKSNDAKIVAHTASTVVIADYIFTMTAVIAQPVTGIILAANIGWPITSGWVFVSLLLYAFIGLFWIPVIFIQTIMRDIALAAAANDAPLPRAYHRLYRIWFYCGIPAFTAILMIIWLMLEKPDIDFGL